MYVSVIQCW